MPQPKVSISMLGQHVKQITKILTFFKEYVWLRHDNFYRKENLCHNDIIVIYLGQ